MNDGNVCTLKLETGKVNQEWHIFVSLIWTHWSIMLYNNPILSVSPTSLSSSELFICMTLEVHGLWFFSLRLKQLLTSHVWDRKLLSPISLSLICCKDSAVQVCSNGVLSVQYMGEKWVEHAGWAKHIHTLTLTSWKKYTEHNKSEIPKKKSKVSHQSCSQSLHSYTQDLRPSCHYQVPYDQRSGV